MMSSGSTVFDGTSLDYALKVEGGARLFVEAKSVGKQLSRNLGTDVSRRINKRWVTYLAGKRSLVQIVTQEQRLVVYLNLDPSKAKPWNDKKMRDVRGVGHWGSGGSIRAGYDIRPRRAQGPHRALVRGG